MMLYWDVMNGVARRSWARNPGAGDTIRRAMAKNDKLKVTTAQIVKEKYLEGLF